MVFATLAACHFSPHCFITSCDDVCACAGAAIKTPSTMAAMPPVVPNFKIDMPITPETGRLLCLCDQIDRAIDKLGLLK